jgi:hypothetical protein
MDLEEVWRRREEEVYPALFGSERRGIFVLSQEVFARFGASNVDPRWLFYGVLEFAPTAARASWVYVTSGCSNPWLQDPGDYDLDGESGSGIEFLLQTTERGDWAIQTLQNMLTFDLLLAAGRFAGREALGPGDRIPLRSPIDGRASLIRNLVVVEAEGVEASFALPSGRVGLAGFTGATDAEIDLAKAETSHALIERLRGAGYHPVIDPHRKSLV